MAAGARTANGSLPARPQRHNSSTLPTARGGVVDEPALVEALKSGHLGGAMLDVFEQEPLKEGGAAFDGVPNLILTPHIAGVSEESNVRVSALTARNVRRALEQRP